jgi:hypothetical protein
MDPDPGGPKRYGSGSGYATLERNVPVSVGSGIFNDPKINKISRLIQIRVQSFNNWPLGSGSVLDILVRNIASFSI